MSPRNPKFFNRELSWLEFNQRVLDEARDESVPLLERLNFLTITASNLDEFFMVRVGGLQMLRQQGVTKTDLAKMTPAEQLEAIDARVRRMTAGLYACFAQELVPQLQEHGIRRFLPSELNERQVRGAERFFRSDVFPVVTPMAVDLRGRFPLLKNLGLNVAVRLRGREPRQRPRFAVIPIGTALERVIPIPSQEFAFVLIEDLIGMFVEQLFPGEKVAEQVAFRITRNADLSIREDQAADLLAEMMDLLDARKQSSCVRLEIDEKAGKGLLRFLQKALNVSDGDVFRCPGPLDLSAFRRLVTLDGFRELKYENWPPQATPDLDLKAGIFKELSRRSVLLCHPYESFDPVLRLVQEASQDPDVLAIKQILYRTSRDSPVVAALRSAAEAGKYVTVIVELKARFDEARNIEWATGLEQAGVQVIYGVKGLKTHAKVCIVVRREPQGVVRYLHFGTGNYNETTARIYSDISYLTTDPVLASDASAFFNSITGYSQPQKLLKLEAAPVGLRERLVELIENEVQRKRQGQKALIIAKMNSLVDSRMISALYDASRAGVKIQLNVRGICCLRPGVRGLSENISVVSIVDRFLEHARIFYFHQGGEERVFISSADWMTRNLNRRVELLVPVEPPELRKRLNSILETYFKDNVKSRRLLPDGSYQRLNTGPGRRPFRSQEVLYRQTCDLLREERQARRTVFEPHRPPESQ
jgi:polyphosphate kinase